MSLWLTRGPTGESNGQKSSYNVPYKVLPCNTCVTVRESGTFVLANNDDNINNNNNNPRRYEHSPPCNSYCTLTGENSLRLYM